MALGHLKINKSIANLTTEMSAEAVACRTFYQTLKTKFLEDFKWPFATYQVALALVTTSPFPIDTLNDSEWAYAYRYPANAVNLVRILSGTRNESRQDRVPYRILHDGAGKLILTDMQNAVLEFTDYEAAEDSFSSSAQLALSLLVSVYIAPIVAGGDPFKLGDRALKLYMMELNGARNNALNEEQMEEEPESEMIRARS